MTRIQHYFSIDTLQHTWVLFFVFLPFWVIGLHHIVEIGRILYRVYVLKHGWMGESKPSLGSMFWKWLWRRR